MGRVLQLGETALMVYALRTFGRVGVALRRSRPGLSVCLRSSACCRGVAEWLKAHSAPKARVPSLKRPRAPRRMLRRGGRVAEGARLESVYAGNRIAGSNPAPSAISLFGTIQIRPKNGQKSRNTRGL